MGCGASTPDQLKRFQIDEVAFNEGAIAFVTGTGQVVVRGLASHGGVLGGVVGRKLRQEPVKNIAATYCGAFAAVTLDGRVFAWGSKADGGELTSVVDDLAKHKVRHIYSSYNAFAAVLDGGGVLTWGEKDWGGDCTSVRDKLQQQQVERVYSTAYAFAAVMEDGSVVTWGDPKFGGELCVTDHGECHCEAAKGPSKISNALSGKRVKRIVSTNYAFAAIMEDGSVVTWGDASAGGDSEKLQKWMSQNAGTPAGQVKDIVSTQFLFAALMESGDVVIWDKEPEFMIQNTNFDFGLDGQKVSQLWANDGAFAAKLENGAVCTRGAKSVGGNISNEMQEALLGKVVDIVPGNMAFAAIKTDGSVVTWGDPRFGGDCSSVQKALSAGRVVRIIGAICSFLAILDNGDVVPWGDLDSGGDLEAGKTSYHFRKKYLAATSFCRYTPPPRVGVQAFDPHRDVLEPDISYALAKSRRDAAKEGAARTRDEIRYYRQ